MRNCLKNLHPIDRALIMVVGALVFLAIVFGIASIFVEPFRANGAAMVTIILGGLTTMASIITGVYFMRDLKNVPREEVEKEEDKDAN